MSVTAHKSVLLMHSQERNRHGNIFGGYLMRTAYELAWGTASLYGRGLYPVFFSLLTLELNPL